MKNHALGKHGKANYEECFVGAEKVAAELVAKVSKGGGTDAKGGGGGLTKAEKKKKMEAGLDDLLSAGLSGGKKKGK
jgi:hypothetical protein